MSSYPRFTPSSLSHSSRWSYWGTAQTGRRNPFPDAAPGASERSEGEDTTVFFPTLFRGGAVTGRGANDANDFDGYHIAG